MTILRSRVPVLALIHGLLFCLLSTTAPNGGAESLPAPPDPEELALIEELSAWVDQGKPSQDESDSVTQAIRESSQSFELFRRFHTDASRNALLTPLPYGSSIRSAAERYNLDGLLLAAIVEAESGFNPQAVSSRGAVGLMQIMPANAAPEARENLTNPDFNIDLGAAYLRRLLKRYGGDLQLALAAYNAGPSAVRRFGGIPPYRETRRYVEKVLRIYVDHHRALWRSEDSDDLLALL